jgi:hypothetical protein
VTPIEVPSGREEEKEIMSDTEFTNENADDANKKPKIKQIVNLDYRGLSLRQIDGPWQATVEFRSKDNRRVSVSLFDVAEGKVAPDLIEKVLLAKGEFKALNYSTASKSTHFNGFSDYWTQQIKIMRQLHAWQNRPVPEAKAFL